MIGVQVSGAFRPGVTPPQEPGAFPRSIASCGTRSRCKLVTIPGRELCFPGTLLPRRPVWLRVTGRRGPPLRPCGANVR